MNDISKLISTSEEDLKQLRQELSNQRIVLTNGCFDILHIGHIRYLQEAQSLGDKLIVGLNSDSSVKRIKGDSRPINDELARAEMLSALSCVDYIYIFDGITASKLVELIQPDIYVKGGDYKLEELPEKEALDKTNTQYQSLGFYEGYSTTALIAKLAGM